MKEKKEKKKETIFTWLQGKILQRTDPKIHLPMKVERGVNGTDTRNILIFINPNI